MSEWRPIETAPVDEGVLILADKSSVWVGEWHETERAWLDYYDHEGGRKTEPTHWMPLPEPPHE